MIREITKSETREILRKEKILAMRVAGLSIEKMYDKLISEYRELVPDNYSKNDIMEELDEELSKWRIRTRASAENVIPLEVNRLDELFAKSFELANDHDIPPRDRVSAIRTCIMIMERRARLLGLDKPKSVEIQDYRLEIVKWLREGRITEDDVRKELGDEFVKRLIGAGYYRDVEDGESSQQSDVVNGKFVSV
ncbi:MAG: hypothetical protein HPY87_08970 [Fervidobacterium sp.]|uniref:hypothetical protein n=1 Tax=Fervidobacterium sp. TaxID=1871331 RepID=UPI0025BAE6D1|nr:hypothetical protein [Fervidobacterium sp.]NPU89992.1 hypothetical protein [Fervidobacterium sp.]